MAGATRRVTGPPASSMIWAEIRGQQDSDGEGRERSEAFQMEREHSLKLSLGCLRPSGRSLPNRMDPQMRMNRRRKAVSWISVSCRKPPNPSSAIPTPRKQLERALTFSPGPARLVGRRSSSIIAASSAKFSDYSGVWDKSSYIELQGSCQSCGVSRWTKPRIRPATFRASSW